MAIRADFKEISMSTAAAAVTNYTPLNRIQMAQRVAQDIPEGWYVNLGIGMPLEVANHIPSDREVIIHAENGVLGCGPVAEPGNENWWLTDAGKQYITLVKGAALVHHADSFVMARGKHLDVSVLGAYQVAENGDMANWALSADDSAPAVGGAMDLAAGAKRLWIMMTHSAKDGTSKLVHRCDLPLTVIDATTRIYTDLAVIDVTPDGFEVIDMIPGLTFERLQELTTPPLKLKK
jgi:3-oxoadipate CoA-transferase beta subunit